MPNLIPHLSHRRQIATIGVNLSVLSTPDYVALSLMGDLWPLDETRVHAELATLRHDRNYREILSGPVYVFQRKTAESVSTRSP
jgi:hypothetical protein